jgi:serine/threonine protein kinase
MEAQHPSDKTLTSFRLGHLDENAAALVEQHLETCPECWRRAASMSSASFGRWVGGQRKGGRTSSVDPMVTDDGPREGIVPAAGTLPPGLAQQRDYEIKKELGRGGMGVVYLAQNTLLGRDEVLKVMGRHIVERPGVSDRFMREIRAVAKLRHPNIVSAYTAFRLDEGIVFAMEYIEGLDLSKMVKTKGPLPVAHASNFAYQTALGLQHAHEEGLVHRDIKPGNLMLSRRGEKATIKILDFGLAKATREENVDGGLTAQGQVLGTPDFIAPEQIMDARSADIRADIYSLGGTLYYLLAGRPPFTANSLYEICQAHISRTADLLNLVRPEVPSELAALVARMMAKEPARRPQTPKEVADALAPFFKKARTAGASPRVDVSGAVALNEQTQPDTDADADADADGAKIDVESGVQPATSVAESRWESLVSLRHDEGRGDRAPAAVSGPRSSRGIWPAVVAASLVGLIVVGGIIGSQFGARKETDRRETAKVDEPGERPATQASTAAEAIASGPAESDPAAPARGGEPEPAATEVAVDIPPPAASKSNARLRSFSAADMSTAAAESIRRASHSVYTDDFDDPASGWSRGETHGYSAGVYWIRSTSWRGPRRIRMDSAIEVVGRVNSEQTESDGAWTVTVSKLIENNRRGLMVKINGKGELFLLPHPETSEAYRNIDPTIGPIVHPAIKPGGAWNTLLLVMRKRKLEILVNSVRVWEPVTLNFDPTPSLLVLGAVQGSSSFRAEFDRVELREFWDSNLRLSPTAYNTIRSATRSFYIDEFNDSKSGWNKGEHCGYSGGFYFLDLRDGQLGRKLPGPLRKDSAVEVVGRLKSPGSSTRGSWGVVVIKETGADRRGFMVKINAKGQLFLLPDPWRSAKDFQDVEPAIGPIANRAIMSANQLNRLLLVIRKRSLEIFVNGVAVCDPVPYDFDLTPSIFQLGAFDGPAEIRAEFDSVVIREFIRP